MKKKSAHACVSVVGAGMIGRFAALALARAGFQVTFIAPRLTTKTLVLDDPFDLRVSALTPRTLSLLREWQVPNLDQRVAPFLSMWVHDRLGQGEIIFHARELPVKALAFLIENQWLCQQLDEALSREKINWLETHVTDLQPKEEETQLWLADGRRHTTPLVIAADGATSLLRSKAHIACQETSYQQVAFVATIRSDRPHEFMARQCFLPTGPVALLPLPHPQLYSLVWSMDESKQAFYQHCPDQKFCEDLRTTQITEANLSLDSERQIFPLKRREVKNYFASRVVLVGDALHTFHPLAGQGANLGFEDVRDLVQILKETQEKNRDLGATITLARYQRQRKRAVTQMLWAMEGFHRLFTTEHPGVVCLRSFGLNRVNRCQALKNSFARMAMGGF